MRTDPLILVDADVLIHLLHAEKVSLLNTLFPRRLRMLDIVLNELRANRSVNQKLTMVFALSGIVEIAFPTSPSSPLLKEYISLNNRIDGKGERATLVYCRHNSHIIASSNTRDIRPYCEEHGLSFLTTFDIFCIAVHRTIISESEAQKAITDILRAGSKLHAPTMDEYRTRFLVQAKLNF